jgi:hypothetical protein
MARLDTAAERACTRTAQSAARAAMAGAGVEATLKGFLFVRLWRGGELDRGGAGGGHMACMGMPAHGAYMARG